MRVAIIPARGGSKRIPGKNIKDFCGKPVIGWSIEAARQSQCFDRIIVSTDDTEIADIARHFGAEAPFMRPATLADDHSTTSSAIAHAVQLLQQQHEIELACCIYATAPFLQSSDLRQSLDTILKKDIDFCFSATRYRFPIQRAFRLKADGRCEMFQPELQNTRSQDLEPAYHDAAQFYWGQARAWLQQRPLFSDRSIPFLLPQHRVQDIDTLQDWVAAEHMFRALSKASA